MPGALTLALMSVAAPTTPRDKGEQSVNHLDLTASHSHFSVVYYIVRQGNNMRQVSSSITRGRILVVKTPLDNASIGQSLNEVHPRVK